METVEGGECSIDADLNLPSDDCYYVATGPTSTLESSVMALPYLPGNDQWCDITEARLHHSDIPTKHNTMCDRKSVFEVVRQSPDFSGYQPLNSTLNAPDFTILQPSDINQQAYIFILDYSNSMQNQPKEAAENQRRIARMKRGIKRFMEVEVDLELGLPMGVVSFSSIKETRIDQNIIQITNVPSRDEIVNTVMDLDCHKDTCLHTGIQRGLQALKEFNVPSGGTAIFITDGGQYCMKENGNDGVTDWLNEIIDDVLRRNVRFCTIAFSSEADPYLEEIAARYTSFCIQIQIMRHDNFSLLQDWWSCFLCS